MNSRSAPVHSGPELLREALATAQQDHTDVIQAVSAMENLRGQAQETLQPHMTYDEWLVLDRIRDKIGLAALDGAMSDTDVMAAIQSYAVEVQDAAARLGVI